jgi:sigma-B regulation protein RsbU (phosphoserine phosphatase)
VTQQELAREAFHRALLGDDPELLYDRAPCGYLSTTPDGRIVKVNQTFLTWTGHDRAALLQRSFVDLLTPGGRLYHETHYAPMLRLQGSVRELALELVRADGGRLPVLVNATLESDAAGAPVAVRIAVFDATERREYERELLRAKERAEESERRARELARTLQQTLLPPAVPVIAGLDVAAAFRAAGEGAELSGDFYDFVQTGPEDWVVVLGDVCGKGVQAAVLTSLVRHTVRAVVVDGRPPAAALAAVNEVLVQNHTDRFCTLVLLRLRRGPDGWTASVGRAGHPPPLLRRPGEAPADVGGDGPLVGVRGGPGYTDGLLELRPGEALVLFTDGVTEARGRDDFFGRERLRSAAARSGGDAAAVVDAVMADVLAFSAGPPRDDIAVLVLRATAGGPSPGPAAG